MDNSVTELPASIAGETARRLDALSPRRILIFRPDHLGDLVMYSGALRNIRNRWPSAHITLVAHSYGRALYKHCPYVDALFPCEELPASLWALPTLPRIDCAARLIRKIWNMRPGSPYRRHHEALKCDLAIFPNVSPGRRHHIVHSLLPARVKIGICGSGTNQSNKSDIATRGIYTAQMDVSGYAPNYPEMETNRHFMSLLGIEVTADDMWPEFWTAPADVETARKLVGDAGARKILGIAPGVSSPKGKQLPVEWYTAGFKGVDLAGFDVVLMGGKVDAEICGALEVALRSGTNAGRIVNLAGQTSILELIECIRLCDIMVCPDAAPLHIATALRKPAVGILGGGHFGRFYPWGDAKNVRVVNKQMSCYGCNWKCQYESMRCIQEIPASDTRAAILSLMNMAPPDAALNEAAV